MNIFQLLIIFKQSKQAGVNLTVLLNTDYC